MSDLIVFVFEEQDGATRMREKLLQLQKEGVISLRDAAVVVRRPDGEVKIKQLSNMTGEVAVGGGILGLLIGTLFLAPWLGLAIGAVGGALVGKRTDVGIDDKFIREVSEAVEPGHSALFLLVYRIVEKKVMPELAAYNAKVLRTTLSAEDENKLKEVLAGTKGAE
jgi:uncharacterized membrane protein